MNDEILEKVRKLLALAGNNPSEEEAKAAMLKAQELMLKYHIDNPETVDDDRVVMVYCDLTRERSQFVEFLSVIVSDNFRSKTVYQGQRIYFIGFEADAKAAVEVYVYLLNFSDASIDRFFGNGNRSYTDICDWQFGFLAGLHLAFSGRKGYELMVRTPKKVNDLFDKLRRQEAEIPKTEVPRKIRGAFTDGFRRGRESMQKKELEMA